MFSNIVNYLNTYIFTGGVLDTMTFDLFNQNITLGNYLSTTTTIILMILFVVCLVKLVVWVVCLFGNAFRGK